MTSRTDSEAGAERPSRKAAIAGRVRRAAAVGIVVPALLWGALAGWVGVRLAGQAPDDMFITYRYAWNLGHGEGFVFNPGERVFGLTNPGLGLLLGLLHGATRAPVHLLGTAVFALSLWALAMIVWGEGRRVGYRFEAAVGGTLVLASSFVWTNQGSASATVLALLAASAVLAERFPITAGLLAGAAVWCRPDAGLGVAALGLLLWAGGRRLPWRWGLAAAGTIGAGLLAAWLWFGAALPQTLEAKRIMAASREAAWVGPTRFWARAAQFFPRHWGAAWLLAGGMGLAGLWPLALRGERAIRTVVLYGAAVAIAYPLLGVPFYSWYAVPCLVAALYGLAALGGGIGRAVGAVLPGPVGLCRALAYVVAFLVVAVPALSMLRASERWLGRETGAGRYASYREAGLWIREHSLPEERIAFGEIGNLAYWSRRPVDDLMGLVTPRALPYVAAGEQVGAFLELAPELVVDHPQSPHAGIAVQGWFRRAYAPVQTIEPPPDGHGAATVYRRRPGAELPAPPEVAEPD